MIYKTEKICMGEITVRRISTTAAAFSIFISDMYCTYTMYITVLFKNLNSIKFKLNKKNYFLKGEKNLRHILIFGGPSNKQLFFLFSLHYFTIFRYGTSVFKSRAHRPLLVCVYCHCLKSLKETGPYFI